MLTNIIERMAPQEVSVSETHVTAPTNFVEADGVKYAYRRWGREGATPLIFIPHYRAGMDHWDPVITDGLARDREVILFNGRGVASSSGEPRETIQEMADDIAAFIRAIGLRQVDALGFSIGGMQVQELALRHPELVAGRHVIVVDDVFTTGSTVSACALCLKRGGASAVGVLTVARAI